MTALLDTAAQAAQRLEALKTANEHRMAGAKVRADLKALSMRDGMLHVAGLLDDPSEGVGSMRVGHLLSGVRRFAQQKVTVLLRDAGVVSWDRRLRELSVRQRGVLAAELRRAAKR